MVQYLFAPHKICPILKGSHMEFAVHTKPVQFLKIKDLSVLDSSLHDQVCHTDRRSKMLLEVIVHEGLIQVNIGKTAFV